MKNLVKNTVQVNREENCSEFTYTFKVPFMEQRELLIPMTFEEVILTFADVIAEAIEARMNSCIEMLHRNLDSIIVSNDYTITFKKSDGSIHAFNHFSFRAMEEALDMINNGRVDFEKSHCDQIMKALVWVEKPEPRNKISFGNVISAMMERTLFNN